MDYVVCLDASIQSSGVSIYNINTQKMLIYSYTNKIKKELSFTVDNFEILIEKQKGKIDNYFERYVHIAERIHSVVMPRITKDTLFIIEGYAYSGGGKNFNIGEFGGLLKYNFYKEGYGLVEIPPSEWKKGAIGKGNANKEAIYEVISQSEFKSVFEKFDLAGYPYKKGGFIEDIADVCAIQKYVLSKYVY